MMAEINKHNLDFIISCVQAIKFTIERHQMFNRDEDIESSILIISSLETIKFLAKRSHLHLIEADEIKYNVRRGILPNIILDRLIVLYNSEFFYKYQGIRLDKVIIRELNRDNKDLLYNLPFDMEIRNILDLLIDIVSSSSIQTELPLNGQFVRDSIQLKKIVPGQKVAPIQFEIFNSILKIKDQSPVDEKEHKPAIVASLNALIENGSKIIRTLQQSNCDKRLVESIEDLQNQLTSTNDIIKLAITNIGCGEMSSAFSNELPNAVVAMLKAHTFGVSMYVAQFPEWALFTENASVVELNKKDVDDIIDISNNLVVRLEDLSRNNNSVDFAVPQTIKQLTFLLSNPGEGLRRVAFAMIRTIENLVSKLFTYAGEFMEDTIQKTSKALSSSISKVAVIAFLTVATYAANGLVPLSQKVTEVSWVRNALEIVNRQIETLKKE